MASFVVNGGNPFFVERGLQYRLTEDLALTFGNVPIRIVVSLSWDGDPPELQAWGPEGEHLCQFACPPDVDIFKPSESDYNEVRDNLFVLVAQFLELEEDDDE